MIFDPILRNLISWWAQALIVALVGMGMVKLLRIRDPRSHLVFCYVLLGVCVALPVIQPWQQPGAASVTVQSIAGSPDAALETENSAAATVTFNEIVWITLVAGIAARLFWLGIGLVRIRRYRASAVPLIPAPDSVREAKLLTGQDAPVCLSAENAGPVTFGFVRPVVLLPSSFQELDVRAQTGVVCHELAHVRRRDWIVTVVEETIQAIFWFQPGFWWILGRARLAREQCVDLEVVRLLQAREPYIAALLAMSGARYSDVVPAMRFLRKRHLAERMRMIVSKTSMSRLRLWTSYSAISFLLMLGGGLGSTLFPLSMSGSKLQEPAPTDGAGVTVDPGAPVVHRTSVFYPWEALQKKLDGAVIVQVITNSRGEVADAQILSGPEEFRKDVLLAVLQWHYPADGSPSKRFQVRIDFRSPQSADGPNRPAPLSLEQNGILESIDVSALPPALRTNVWARIRGYKGTPFSEALVRQIETALAGADSHLGVRWSATEDGNHILRLVLNNTKASTPAAAPPRKAIPQNPALRDTPAEVDSSTQPAESGRVERIGNGVTPPRILKRVNPVYTDEARAVRISGTVVFEVVVHKDGSPEIVRAVRSLGYGLDESAAAALAQWRFEPGTKNGEPVDVGLFVEVNFNLQ